MDTGFLYAMVIIAVGLIPAGITYGVIRWLKKRAKATPTLLDDIFLITVGTPLIMTCPAPVVYFHEFGESVLNGHFLLRTNNYTHDQDVPDRVNRRIARRFREGKIEMPFRQVDMDTEELIQGG